jgi:hypothetical protein
MAVCRTTAFNHNASDGRVRRTPVFSGRDGTLRGLFRDCGEGPCQLSETFTSEVDSSPSAGPSPSRGRWLAIGAVLGVAAGVALAVVLWLVFRGDGDGEPSPAPAKPTAANGAPGAGAVAVSAAELRALAAALGHPIYWLGRKPGVTYELTRTDADAVFVRYLPSGVATGENRPYLTVATYPFPGAFASVQRSAARNPTGTIRLSGGGLAVVDAGYPKSIHVAYPGVPYQVEVFDPSPARARAIASSGQVKAVG